MILRTAGRGIAFFPLIKNALSDGQRSEAEQVKAHEGSETANGTKSNRERVVDLLLNKGPNQVRAIADALGITGRVVQEQIRVLLAKKKLRRVPHENDFTGTYYDVVRDQTPKDPVTDTPATTVLPSGSQNGSHEEKTLTVAQEMTNTVPSQLADNTPAIPVSLPLDVTKEFNAAGRKTCLRVYQWFLNGNKGLMHEIAQALSINETNIDRYLNVLHHYGLIEFTLEQKSGKRGRRGKVYELKQASPQATVTEIASPTIPSTSALDFEEGLTDEARQKRTLISEWFKGHQGSNDDVAEAIGVTPITALGHMDALAKQGVISQVAELRKNGIFALVRHSQTESETSSDANEPPITVQANAAPPAIESPRSDPERALDKTPFELSHAGNGARPARPPAFRDPLELKEPANRQIILNFLRRNNDTVYGIAQKTSMSMETVYEHIYALQLRGIVIIEREAGKPHAYHLVNDPDPPSRTESSLTDAVRTRAFHSSSDRRIDTQQIIRPFHPSHQPRTPDPEEREEEIEKENPHPPLVKRSASPVFLAATVQEALPKFNQAKHDARSLWELHDQTPRALAAAIYAVLQEMAQKRGDVAELEKVYAKFIEDHPGKDHDEIKVDRALLIKWFLRSPQEQDWLLSCNDSDTDEGKEIVEGETMSSGAKNMRAAAADMPTSDELLRMKNLNVKVTVNPFMTAAAQIKQDVYDIHDGGAVQAKLSSILSEAHNHLSEEEWRDYNRLASEAKSGNANPADRPQFSMLMHKAYPDISESDITIITALMFWPNRPHEQDVRLAALIEKHFTF